MFEIYSRPIRSRTVLLTLTSDTSRPTIGVKQTLLVNEIHVSSSAGLTIVTSVAIATGPAIIYVKFFFVSCNIRTYVPETNS